MRIPVQSYPVYIILLSFIYLPACNNPKPPPASDIVQSPEELDKKTSAHIKESLQFAAANDGNIGDSVFLTQFPVVQLVYDNSESNPVWAGQERWKPLGDSLLNFIAEAKLYGLFPEDYHFPALDSIRRRFEADSLVKADRKDAVLWSKADLLLTDAFFHLLKDIKLGRLPQDSISLRKDSVLTEDFYIQQFNILQKGGSVTKLIRYLEPKHQGYHMLKASIPGFLEKADDREFTMVPSPKDTVNFRAALQKRLYEGGYIAYDSVRADSATLAAAVKKFQKEKNMAVDGRAGEATVRMLNMSDREKFIRIAISMDKYKMLPERMPDKYIWVNLPGYYLQLWNGDSVEIFSKVVCGKPITRTPQLNSAISEMITYPQWTVPNSIIVKEILPAAKKDPGYFARKGFSLVDKNGEEVDPYTVEWSKYSKGMPYKVVQGSGDANALGVLKFNFNNKYSVYLHDTNQRSFFSLAARALSHGCVRVQEWNKLSRYILTNDSLQSNGRNAVRTDSMLTWLSRKEKHSIPVRNRIPLFIRYFTAEVRDSSLVFYDDMYGEDKRIKEKYFAKK